MVDREMLARNIREIRLNKNITATEVAKLLGLLRTTYCNYEKGNRPIPAILLLPLSEILGCSLYDFFIPFYATECGNENK